MKALGSESSWAITPSMGATLTQVKRPVAMASNLIAREDETTLFLIRRVNIFAFPQK
jgi:hypothetical protein